MTLLLEPDSACKAELDADTDWFLAHPRRCIRIRRAFYYEAREFGPKCPPGCRVFTVVKQIGPGICICTQFLAPREFVAPLTERGTVRFLERFSAALNKARSQEAA
jgi:hypothetical protein